MINDWPRHPAQMATWGKKESQRYSYVVCSSATSPTQRISFTGRTFRGIDLRHNITLWALPQTQQLVRLKLPVLIAASATRNVMATLHPVSDAPGPTSSANTSHLDVA